MARTAMQQVRPSSIPCKISFVSNSRKLDGCIGPAQDVRHNWPAKHENISIGVSLHNFPSNFEGLDRGVAARALMPILRALSIRGQLTHLGTESSRVRDMHCKRLARSSEDGFECLKLCSRDRMVVSLP